MTNMLFAGIPLEGSGNRPLDADLYGPDAKAGDVENISATGNLNIGTVIDYDEHAERHMNGGIRDGEQGSYGSANAPRHFSALYSDNSDNSKNPSTIHNPLLANTAALNHASVSQNDHAAHKAVEGRAYAPQAQSQAASLPSGGGGGGTSASGSDSSSTTTSTTTTTTTNNTTTTNTYNTTTTTTNNYYNETNVGGDAGDVFDTVNNAGDNLFETINHALTEITDITHILPGLPSLPGGDVINTLGDTINEVTNLLPDLPSLPGSDIINNLDDTIGDVVNLGDAGGILEDVVNIADTTLGNITGGDITNVITNVTDTADGLLGAGISGDLTGVVHNIPLDVVTDVTAPAIDAVLEGGVGQLLDQTNVTDIVAATGDEITGTVTEVIDAIPVDALTPALEIADNLPVVDNLDTGQLIVNSQAAVENIVGDVSDSITAITQNPADIPAVIQDVAQGVTGEIENLGLLDMLGNATGGQMLLDVNLSAAGDEFADANDNALINIDATALNENDSAAQANGGGLLDIDTSLLSDSGDVEDNTSITLNPDAVLSGVMGTNMDVTEINIPTPSGSDVVPMFPSLLDAADEQGSTINDASNGLLDPGITLSVLDQAGNLPIAAVDTGILFTGASGTIGGGAADSGAVDAGASGNHSGLLGGALGHIGL